MLPNLSELVDRIDQSTNETHQFCRTENCELLLVKPTLLLNNHHFGASQLSQFDRTDSSHLHFLGVCIRHVTDCTFLHGLLNFIDTFVETYMSIFWVLPWVGREDTGNELLSQTSISQRDLFNRSVQEKSAVGCCKRETSNRRSKAGKRERGKHSKERAQRREKRSLKSTTRYETAIYRDTVIPSKSKILNEVHLLAKQYHQPRFHSKNRGL